MTRRHGKLTDCKLLHEQENGSKVYEFSINGGEERLTMCSPAGERTPADGNGVFITLHPADSKWPKHVAHVIFDVPDHVLGE